MKITDHIYIVASGKWGFGMTSALDCNVFLVDTGDGCVLIDSGVNMETERMDEIIRSHGFELTDIKAVLLTHYHADHACGAARIREATGCVVMAPAKEAHAIEIGDEEATSVAGGKGLLYPADYSYPKCPGVEPLVDGEQFCLGDVTFTAYAVPGHSCEGVVYTAQIDGKNCMFTGDAVFACGQVLIQSLYDVSLYPYGQAMKRLSELDVDALFPGHGVFLLENGIDHIKMASAAFQSGLIPKQLYYFA